MLGDGWSNNESLVFEVRIRRRSRSDWEVDVFRPFPTDEDLKERVKELREGWSEDESLSRLIAHLEQPDRIERKKLEDRHPVKTFSQSMGVDSLPSIDDEALVIELLTTTPFQSSHGSRWTRGEDDLYTVAPTTDAEFHIVPQSYTGGFVDVDETSCLRCHETVGRHVRRFERGRDWYGRIRGSDGIFSFHPFSASTISHNGMGNPVSMRQDLIDAGLLARYDPEVHSRDVYRRLTFLGE